MNSQDNATPNTNPQPAAGAGQPTGDVPPSSFAALPQPRSTDPRIKSPALACCLSAMPGLGQIYVGYYTRGFTHILIVASIITLLAGGGANGAEPLFGLFLAFFWLYNVIDAGRRASFYNQLLAGGSEPDLPSDVALPGLQGSITGGLLLIGVGTLLLLHTKLDMSIKWVVDWWPVVPILIGVGLLAKAIQERSPAKPE